jgi:DNA excision repair protein ERCC-6
LEYSQKPEEQDSETQVTQDNSEESQILSNLMGSGLQSALHHDRIVESEKPEFMIVEQEAQRIADEALANLRASRIAIQDPNQFAPTWTGRSGSAGNPRSILGQYSSAPKSIGSGSALSSASLLHRLRHGRSSSAASSPTPKSLSSSDSQSELAIRIVRHMKENDNKATSSEIVKAFQLKLQANDMLIFRKILHSIAEFNRVNKQGTWVLKSEFR